MDRCSKCMVILSSRIHLIFSFSIFSTYTSYSLDVRYVCAGSDGNVFVTDLILSLSSGNMVLNLNPNTD